MGTVESLHGTTPAEIFESGLTNIDQIASIAMAVTWRNGEVTAGWSNVDIAQLALMLMTLDEKIRTDTIREASPP